MKLRDMVRPGKRVRTTKKMVGPAKDFGLLQQAGTIAPWN
jgi:hypothetical protein